MGINKILYGGTVVVDITEDTVGAESLLSGVKSKDASGNTISGTLFSNSPTTVTVSKGVASAGSDIPNLVKYDSQQLFSLEDVDVTPDTLLSGYTAHDKTGKYIIGTLLSGYPEIYPLQQKLIGRILEQTISVIHQSVTGCVSNESIPIEDSNGQSLEGVILYKQTSDESIPIEDSNGQSLEGVILYKQTSNTDTSATYEKM